MGCNQEGLERVGNWWGQLGVSDVETGTGSWNHGMVWKDLKDHHKFCEIL